MSPALWLLLPHPRWNQAPQPHGFLSGSWSGGEELSTVPRASPYLNFGILKIPILQWHTENHAKGSAGQPRFPALLWSAGWIQQSLLLMSVPVWQQLPKGRSDTQSTCCLWGQAEVPCLGSLQSLWGRFTIAMKLSQKPLTWTSDCRSEHSASGCHSAWGRHALLATQGLSV